jgi:hypothetical protein
MPLDAFEDAGEFDSLISVNIQRTKLAERVRALRDGDLEYAEYAGIAPA